MLETVLALTPILWLLISLGALKIPAHRAAPIGLLLSLLIAVASWKMSWGLVLSAALEGMLFSLVPILWVIVAAFFNYNLSQHTGAIDHIKDLLFHCSADRRIQALVIAWGFGSFMESVAGFGTAVAVPAALLIALGFDPFRAAIVCLIANTVAVAFGVVGIPVTTLEKITDLPTSALSLDIGLQLTPFVFLVPLLVVYATTGTLAALRGVWLTTLLAGASFGLVQFAVAQYVGPELPAIVASLTSSAVILLAVKLSPPAQLWRFPAEPTDSTRSARGEKSSHGIASRAQLVAWLPYILLLCLVLTTSRLFPAVHEPLHRFRTSWLIFSGNGGKPLVFDWLLTPGTLVFIAAIIAGLVQGASMRSLVNLLVQTLRQLQKTIITVISIVSMAKVLGYSGMVASVAITLADATGCFYPAFAPLIGALGTFITGSDTSSNILFGLLQKQTALQLGISPVWIAAANTSGACIGKLISPQSISIAATATGLLGKEGDLLSVTFRYALCFLVGLGFLTFVFTY
jgi:lactate permease